jgi:hypothetical protein
MIIEGVTGEPHDPVSQDDWQEFGLGQLPEGQSQEGVSSLGS